MILAVVTAIAALLYHGHFALQVGTPVVAASLKVTPLAGGRQHFDIVQTRAGKTVRDYDIDMTKPIHLIIISDDLRSFEHLHPRLHSDGHFTLDATVPSGGYHVYADTMPRGIGQQVFRFDVGPQSEAPAFRATNVTARAGPYVVTLATPAVSARAATLLRVRIFEHGKPATDLQPYLGAAGHAVFINVRDLSYVHVHPMLDGNPAAMGAMNMGEMRRAGSRLLLHVELHEPGIYRLWFQFMGASKLRVAAFTLKAA